MKKKKVHYESSRRFHVLEIIIFAGVCNLCNNRDSTIPCSEIHINHGSSSLGQYRVSTSPETTQKMSCSHLALTMVYMLFAFHYHCQLTLSKKTKYRIEFLLVQPLMNIVPVRLRLYCLQSRYSDCNLWLISDCWLGKHPFEQKINTKSLGGTFDIMKVVN